MRHLKRTAKLGRTSEHRNAMLAKVVVMRLCSIKLQTILASIALRCSEVRPNLAVRFKCLMGFP